MQHLDIFYNQNATPECILTTNTTQSLDEPTQTIKDQLNPTNNSFKHNKIIEFKRETSSTTERRI